MKHGTCGCASGLMEDALQSALTCEGEGKGYQHLARPKRPKLSDGGHEARGWQPRRPAAVRCSAWLSLDPESKNMNVGKINSIALLGLLKLKLSCEIRPLAIHRKVMIDGES